MDEVLNSLNLSQVLNGETLLALLKGLAVLLGGIIIVRLGRYLLRKFVMARATDTLRNLAVRTFNTLGMIVVLLFALSAWGVNPAPLLGAAGVVGVALSIASQTSLANIVSGVFLLSEKPFTLGDVISAGSHTGVVKSIDLLSVKILTFDNRYIRIPSERILNSEVINVTRFPIRRQDITIYLPYSCDLQEVQTLLKKINDDVIYCLNEPSPLVLLQEIGPSGIKLLFGVWFQKSDYVTARNAVIEEIISRFRERDIEFQIPMSHTLLSAADEQAGLFEIANALQVDAGKDPKTSDRA